MTAGSSAIPSLEFLRELEDAEFRNGFVADRMRTRFALLIRSLREQMGWSQAELGERMGKPQSVISRLEDPDYGRLSTKTIFEVAAAFGLPVYIDLPNWDEWFRLMEDVSARAMVRQPFNAASINALANGVNIFLPQPPPAVTINQIFFAGGSSGITVGYYSYELGLSFITPPDYGNFPLGLSPIVIASGAVRNLATNAQGTTYVAGNVAVPLMQSDVSGTPVWVSSSEAQFLPQSQSQGFPALAKQQQEPDIGIAA